MTTPAACRHCHLTERAHGLQYTNAAGWHHWAPPTDQQRLDRMRARRAARKATT